MNNQRNGWGRIITGDSIQIGIWKKGLLSVKHKTIKWMKLQIGDKPEFEKVKNENATKSDGSFLIDEEYFIKTTVDRPHKLQQNKYFLDVISKFDHSLLKTKNQSEMPRGIVYAIREMYLDDQYFKYLFNMTKVEFSKLSEEK